MIKEILNALDQGYILHFVPLGQEKMIGISIQRDDYWIGPWVLSREGFADPEVFRYTIKDLITKLEKARKENGRS